MSISAVASTIVGASNTAGDLSALSGNESTFLSLLTTQLQNQDPLAPTDTNTFTQQLVEYSQVEQQIQTNSKLDTMNTLLVNNKVQDALSMVGAYVQFGGSTFDYTAGTTGTINYNLPSAAATNTITILDSSGNTVYTAQGALTAGDNSFSWDGTTDQGTAAPTGTYTINVAAQDSTGTNIAATTSVWGLATGVQATSTDVLLSLQGGGTVSLDNVSNVSANGPTAVSTTSSGS